MIRVKLYKRLSTPLGMAEITLLDTPLDPAHWTKHDERAIDRLAELATARRPVLSDPRATV